MAKSNLLKLGFVGDFCLAGGTLASSAVLQENLELSRQLTLDTDINIANLEFCINDESSTSHVFMRTTSDYCDNLADWGFDTFCLANNHILDCGPESLLYSRRFLRDRHLRTVGAGANIAEAERPLLLACRGKTIAILNTTDATHYSATVSRPGINPLSARNLCQQIDSIRSNADLLVVCIHSDLEFSNTPAPWKVRLSRLLADRGADIVVHHHPHTLQGIERYNGSLIAYSLGNFIFPVHGTNYMKNREGHPEEGVFLEVSVDFGASSRHLDYRVIPVVIGEDNITHRAEGEDRERICSRLAHYSEYLNQPSYLRQRYFSRCIEYLSYTAQLSYWALRKRGLRGMWSTLKHPFTTLMHRNWLRGLISLGRI